MRVGCFANDSTSRQQSGASYYGVMELGGNVWERAVTVGNTTGRVYTGLQGDGIIDVNGNANVSYWPGINAVGSGFRGSGWSNNIIYLRISERGVANNTDAGSWIDNGFRCVR